MQGILLRSTTKAEKPMPRKCANDTSLYSSRQRLAFFTPRRGPIPCCLGVVANKSTNWATSAAVMAASVGVKIKIAINSTSTMLFIKL